MKLELALIFVAVLAVAGRHVQDHNLSTSHHRPIHNMTSSNLAILEEVVTVPLESAYQPPLELLTLGKGMFFRVFRRGSKIVLPANRCTFFEDGQKVLTNTITTIPKDFPIGFYNLKCDAGKTGLVLVVFNSAAKSGSLSEAEIQEYVMATSGYVYQGSRESNSPLPWQYDQFSSNTMSVLKYVLSGDFKLLPKDRKSEIMVAKHLSKVVNVNDDNGILVGNWGGDYTGGKAPTAWTGSGQIFKEFYSRGYQPVMFGQCWVFAGLLTSLCRALGIPARPVTNFDSGHNSMIGDVSIDQVWSWNGDKSNLENDEAKSDSVWNFHVWVEAWMARPDLSGTGKYDGWQAIDATPQELSERGVMECGPASVVRIKELSSQLHDSINVNMAINTKYDTLFVYGETSASRRTWVPEEFARKGNKPGEKLIRHPYDPTYCLYGKPKGNIGTLALTKAVGSTKSVDVIGNYKDPSEIQVDLEEDEDAIAVTYSASCDTTGLLVGKDLLCTLRVNKIASSGDVTIKSSYVVYQDNYHHEKGQRSQLLSFAQDDFHDSQDIVVNVHPEMYMNVWRSGKVLEVTFFAESKLNGESADSFIGSVPVSFPSLPVEVTCRDLSVNPVICDARFTTVDTPSTGVFRVDADEATICQVSPPTAEANCAGNSDMTVISAHITGQTATATFSISSERTNPTAVVHVVFDAPGSIDGHGVVQFKPVVQVA